MKNLLILFLLTMSTMLSAQCYECTGDTFNFPLSSADLNVINTTDADKCFINTYASSEDVTDFQYASWTNTSFITRGMGVINIMQVFKIRSNQQIHIDGRVHFDNLAMLSKNGETPARIIIEANSNVTVENIGLINNLSYISLGENAKFTLFNTEWKVGDTLTTSNNPEDIIIFESCNSTSDTKEIQPENGIIFDSVMYDYMGRVVTNPQPFTPYIQNGKKFIILK